MGKAGRALKQVLEQYGISQNKLAVTMNLERTVIYRWTHERADPTGETIAGITSALKQINPEAAREFVRLYLGDLVDKEQVDEE
jgi:transcriptional regulator with XRE-family HTH domain